MEHDNPAFEESKINVLVVPSWYPSPSNPLAGIFVKEQVAALSQKIPCANFFIMNWGQGEHELSLRRPGQSFARLKRYLLHQDSGISRTGPYFTVSVPALTWSKKLPFGGLRPLARSAERAFRLVTSQFGMVDLVHAHVCYPAGFVAAELSEQFETPFVLTEHMGPFPFPSLLEGGKLRSDVFEAMQRAAALIAVSRHSAEQVAAFGLPRPKVIPNLVDERRFAPGEVRHGRFVFLTVGSLTKQKGIDLLLNAIARWDSRPNDVLFRIVGEGPERSSLESLACELGIENEIEWFGGCSRDVLPRLFADCDCFVLPSRHESFGIVYAEAHACGKPVIATKCGGPEDFVNAENGILIPTNDIPKLTESLAYMYMNARRYPVAAIRQAFLNRYSRAAVTSEIAKVYQSVTGIQFS